MASVLNFFGELGRGLDLVWCKAQYDTTAFPELASSAIVDATRGGGPDPFDLAAEAMCTVDLPPQGDTTHRFGQPPLTVFRNDRFCIDVLYWFESTTSIHQHAFSGAFHVLHGSSLHAEYDFSLEERVNDRFLLGRVTPKNFELLQRGATRSIAAGNTFIHSLFHLDHPSVSMVVKATAVGTDPQFRYELPGIAVDPFHKPPTLLRQLELLGALFRVRREESLDLAGRMIEANDLASAYRILLKMQDLLEPDVRPINALLERAANHFHRPVNGIAQALDIWRRWKVLYATRASVKDPELRFLLGLLLNNTPRETALRLVSEQYPEDGAPARVARWVQKLTGAGARLRIPALDDLGVRVLQALLEPNPEASLQRLSESAPGDRGRIVGLVKELRVPSVIDLLLVPQRAPR